MKKQAFTLVEQIVTMTILVILGIIAFISLQGYGETSRDSVRISDLSTIKSGLELYELETNKFPEPTNGVNITYSGSIIWTQGTYGESTGINVNKFGKIFTDPLAEKEYTYSVTLNRKEYSLGGILEGDSSLSPFISRAGIDGILETNAGDTTVNAFVIGTYNGHMLKVLSGSICNVLAIPSIIINDTSTGTDLLEILNSQKLVYNGYKNLPSSFIGSKFKNDGGFAYVPNKLVVYTDSIGCSSLAQNETERIGLLKNLQDNYSGTILGENENFKEFINTQIDLFNPNNESKLISRELVSNNLNIKLNETSLTFFNCEGGIIEGYTFGNIAHGLGENVTKILSTTNGLINYGATALCNNGNIQITNENINIICDSGYFWNSSICETQRSGDATSGYLFKNTSGNSQYPLSCSDLLIQSTWKNTLIGSPWNSIKFNDGKYWIKPDANPAFTIYCDMTNNEGGWTLLSNQTTYDGTNVYGISACDSLTGNCGGNLQKLGHTINRFNKIMIRHRNGKYVIIDLKQGGNFEKMFMGQAQYTKDYDVEYIYEDNIHNRSGYSDTLGFWGPYSSDNSMWLSNYSLNVSNRYTYAFKWATNCALIGYSNGSAVCINTGGFSIFVKKDNEVLGTIDKPGKSCKEILISGDSTGDGSYWIKPDTNPAFQVYCDMTTDGGGWTLVRKMQSTSIVTGNTSASNAASLVNLSTASANVSDVTWNSLKPLQVWNICNGYQTVYNRNMAVAWYSNHGLVNTCANNTGFWTSMQKNFGATLQTDFTYQACGGGYSTSFAAWGMISGIYEGSSAYYGCYDSANNVNTTSLAPAKFDNRAGTAIGWGGNGYVLVR